MTFGDIMYPPVALWLFVPFTMLPALLWWAIPLGITAWVVIRHRPSHLVWPLLALPLAWQPVQIHILSGNPGLWAMAAVALGTLYPWAAPFAFLKASLGMFGLIRIHDRRWWAGLAVFCVLSLSVLPMWADWIRVMPNNEGTGGLLYSWQEVPLMLLPIAAWLGATVTTQPGGQ